MPNHQPSRMKFVGCCCTKLNLDDVQKSESMLMNAFWNPMIFLRQLMQILVRVDIMKILSSVQKSQLSKIILSNDSPLPVILNIFTDLRRWTTRIPSLEGNQGQSFSTHHLSCKKGYAEPTELIHECLHDTLLSLNMDEIHFILRQELHGA
jgi:hypothetical protein